MVDTRELEAFLNDKSARKGDIVEITGSGDIEIKDDTNNAQRKYKVLNLPVMLNGTMALEYSPAKLAKEALEKLYGSNTDKWVGKKFVVDFVKMMVKGEMRNVIFPMPLEPIKK